MLTLELVLLGAVAGFTIFLGLPVAIMKRVSANLKGFLNAVTIGVLIFILIEVLPQAKNSAESAILTEPSSGAAYVLALILGLFIGIFGLVLYEMRFVRMRNRKATIAGIESGRSQKVVELPGFEPAAAKQLALSIAIGIGVHNFSEGLAIGQSFASSVFNLTYLLIVGFAIHNATEGFGIAAPMAGLRPSNSYLASLGFIGGFPTLLGTIFGAVYPASPLALTFFLALAAGALIYVISGMFYVARRQTSNEFFMCGLFLGFLVAYGTDLLLVMMHA